MTTHDLLSDDVRELIQGHIDSVAQLEALLFLRAHSGRGWDVPTIAKRLHTSEPEIAHAVERLATDGFLKRAVELYVYDCSNELRETVDRLDAAYQKFLIPITRLVHDNPRQVPDTRRCRTND